MKWCSALALATVSIVTPGTAIACRAQSPASRPQDGQTLPAPAKPAGTVLFQRSLDPKGNTTSATAAAANPASAAATASSFTDADRQAIVVTALDLDVRLYPAAQQLAARATVTVRNNGKAPMPRIPLQISSSLNWERIRVAGRDTPLAVATVNSDSDHTGQLHEAVVSLATPLEPEASVQLQVFYSGTIAATARRLLSVGAPADVAAHSDWDEISPDFTGLRGFGNVLWYPVSSPLVLLGDGARLFDEIGRQKLLSEGLAFHLSLTVEFPHGQPPTTVLVNGNAVSLKVTDTPADSAGVPGTATADTGAMTLGFASPSLFVTSETAHAGPHMTAYSVAADDPAVKNWIAAAANVAPMVERWLGSDPPTQLILLDLPDSEAAPWESGPLLATPMRNATPDRVAPLLAHALAHAWMARTPYWLDEGTANFMGTLWDDHQHHRDQALSTLEAGRSALALLEPPSPGEGAGQPLASAISPVYYRTKAAYVLWMLRDIVGDDALGAALRDTIAASHLGAEARSDVPPSFQSALKRAAPRQNLTWLFTDWIDADHGLPDLSIDKVFPNAVQSGNWLTSVTITNAGYAAAKVPVTVRSATNSTTAWVLIPAHGTVTPRVLVQGQPTAVQVNDGTIPETQASMHVLHLDQPGPKPDVSPAPQ